MRIFHSKILKKQAQVFLQRGLGIFSLYFFSLQGKAQVTRIANGAVVTISPSTITTTPGDINIANAGTVRNKGSIRLQGNWINNGTFSDVNGTVTFNATSGGKTISGLLTGGNKFNDVIFNGINGAWAFQNDAEVGGDLSLNNGSVTAPAGTLAVGGNFTQNSAAFLHNNGLVVFNGLQGQSYKTADLLTFHNLSNNNTFGIPAVGLPGLSIQSDLVIENELQLKSLSKLDLVSGDITLRSTASNTASVAAIPTESNIIIYGAGRFIIERFINVGNSAGQHGKGWQLLSAPAKGQTIKQSWMEAAAANTNPNPGFGTQITGAGGVAGGFDVTSTDPSMKFYVPASDTWAGVSNPVTTAINNVQGYFVFVRGDRSVINFSGINSSPKPTTLRIRGMILTGAVPGPSVSGVLFQTVANPYASAINLKNLTIPAGINTTIITWDPTIGGANGFGAFQTLFLSGGNYVNLLSSTAYGPAGTVHNLIQSGQAFIIQGVGAGGTLNFKEADKAPTSTVLTFAPTSNPENFPQLKTDLYGKNHDGSNTLADGALIQYSTDFANSIDGMDARKMINSSENLSIKSGGKLIVLERRQPIVPTDTIFYNLTGVSAKTYHFEFIASGLGGNGLTGFVEDTYLKTKTLLSLEGTTSVDFAVTSVAGSHAADRFRIVFAPSVALPVTFTSVKAYKQDKNINVEWRVENEMNMKQYEVEKSTNGSEFSTMIIKPATANGGRSAIYVTTDVTPVTGYNYYRVKSVDMNGKIAYTNVVKVLMGSTKQDITISPNPITDGMIHLQLMNEPAGKYGIRLMNKLGQVIVSKQVSHEEGSSTELIKWDFNLAHGMYQLEVTRPDGSIKNINVLN